MASKAGSGKSIGSTKTRSLQSVKLVVVGYPEVGKTTFVIFATSRTNPHGKVAPVFDNFSLDLLLKGLPYSVMLWDTRGRENYDLLRPLTYPETDVFVVCFDVGNQRSFQNVTEKWMPEVRRYAPEAPILLLGNKADLRSNSNASSWCNMVSYKDAKKCASTLHVKYAECSSMSGVGVQNAVSTAVQLAVSDKISRSRKLRFFKRQSTLSRYQELSLVPPRPPSAVKVMTSSFASDWCSTMADTSCTDVRFLFHDGQQEAHRIVLSAASSIFKNIFLGRVSPQHEAYSQIFEDVSWVCDKGSDCPHLADVKEEYKHKGKTVITLDRNICHSDFMEVLRFLYTGSPDIPEDENETFFQELQVVAEKFQLSWLAGTCANLIKQDTFLNPRFMANKLFLDKPLFSDVKFCVEGSIVHAHKAILRARSEVMAAMFCGGFEESNEESKIEIQEASLQSFLALLEYLYTDHAPIEEGDPVEIMVLADRFCLPRLVTLCELYITKRVDASIRKRVADGTSDVINLLLTSQAHNAVQLAQCCLHFISINFSVFEQTEEFSIVQGENREYVEEHRWPPLSYLKELEEYQKQMETSHQSSRCIVM